MQIYVVRPGDSLWSISQTYGISPSLLIQSNQIPNPTNLVIGQTIVIPIQGNYHIVRSGESLYKIGKLYNVPVPELLRINAISKPNQIYPGLRLYIPQKPRTRVDIAAYIDPKISGEKSIEEIDKVADNLTFITIFSYAVNRDGTLTELPNDQPLINAAYRHRAAPLMVLTNFENGTFTPELATAILTNEALQDKILDEAISIMGQKGYLGLDFDFEYLGAQNRERYNQFLRKASVRLKEKNYFISTALAPKLSGEQIGTLYEGHDYKAQGQIVDFIFFMTYEWGWSGGPPLAVSPIDKVRQVMEYAISVVPKNKIMMGIPLYGYDWTLPYVPGGKFAKAISAQQAIEIAAKYKVAIEYDTISQAPHYKYVDEQGIQHKVWFDDARSIQAKFNLVKELGIRGFFYWVLGRDFPQNWLLIQDNFIVNKRV